MDVNEIVHMALVVTGRRVIMGCSVRGVREVPSFQRIHPFVQLHSRRSSQAVGCSQGRSWLDGRR